MGQPYSDDLRARVVIAVAEGCSRRAAAKRFAVSASSSIRWVVLHEQTGSVSPRRCAAKSRSPLEAHASWLLELIDKESDLTLAEISPFIKPTLILSCWRLADRPEPRERSARLGGYRGRTGSGRPDATACIRSG